MEIALGEMSNVKPTVKMATDNKMTDCPESSNKMFGPLTFDELECDLKFDDSEVRCLLCADSFNVGLRLDIFLGHLFDVHQCVIEDVQNIRNLPKYISYWREQLKQRRLEEIIPSVKVGSTGGHYFLFSSLLNEDRKLRHELTLDYVMKVHEFERTDSNYTRQCLFCKLLFKGTRQGFLEHLSEKHNLQLGNPQNLVFTDSLVSVIDAKLQALTCLFCEGVFPERTVLKEHMRKKLHKRINPSDSSYDKYYLVNYLEIGKSWKAIEKEDDRYALSRGAEENSDEEYNDWNEKEDQITCLFCPHKETCINLLCMHMDAEHGFDFVVATQNLDFYQKIKLVNYIRKMVHNKKCPYCEDPSQSLEELLIHLHDMQHFKVPESSVFDQPEYYFPTYENDAFLYLIDDLED